MLLQLPEPNRGGVPAFGIQGLSRIFESSLGGSDQLDLVGVLWQKADGDPEHSVREGLRVVQHRRFVHAGGLQRDQRTGTPPSVDP